MDLNDRKDIYCMDVEEEAMESAGVTEEGCNGLQSQIEAND